MYTIVIDIKTVTLLLEKLMFLQKKRITLINDLTF